MAVVRSLMNTVAKSVLPGEALRAPPHKLTAAAGASPSVLSARGSSAEHRNHPSGLSVLRRPSQGWSNSNQEIREQDLRVHGTHTANPKELVQDGQPSMEAVCRHSTYEQSRRARSVQASALRSAPPALVCFGMQMQRKVSSPREWPNPSIEGTASGLRPPAAPHVKR